MTEHLPILRRVGWLLIVLGMLDIGVLIYCIVNQVSYPSSLNVFAVAAGIFLVRGHLGTVRYVAWSSAFMISASLVALPVIAWLLPAEYWMLLIRRHPLAATAYLLFTVGLLWMLFWVYSQLRLPVVVEARAAAGHPRAAPRSAFLTGAALVIFVAVLWHQVMNSELAKQAERLAEEQYGRDYHYFVSSIEWSGDHVTAEVIAYKRDETKEVTIDLE
jgi:hypothetical protein